MLPRSTTLHTIMYGLFSSLLLQYVSADANIGGARDIVVRGENVEEHSYGDLSAQIIKEQDAEEGDWRTRDDDHAESWSETSSTKTLCSKPDPPANGYTTGDNFDQGGRVSIFCEQGYTLQGPSNITCVAVPNPHVLGGLWIPSDEYTCTLSISEDTEKNADRNHHLQFSSETSQHDEHYLSCEEPQTPENGFFRGNTFHLEGVVFIYCEDGYNLQGPSRITCVPVSPSEPEHGVRWTPNEEYSCLRSQSDEIEIITLETKPKMNGPLYKVYNEDSKSASAEDPRPMPGPTIPGDEQSDSWIPHRRVVSHPNSNMVEGLNALCSLPKVGGPCKAAIPRFFFDTTVMECRPFTYGGCAGNENNFETFKECQYACH